MASIRNAVIQGGLLHRETQDYDEQQARRAHAARTRQFGVKTMDLGERKMAAEGEMLDTNTALQKLRQEIEQTELQFQQKQQPASQKLRTVQMGVATGEAEAAKKLQPGATKIAEESQNVAEQTLMSQQAANLWSMVKTGGKAEALELLNKSAILHPGRKFSDIQRGEVPAMGADGKPITGADGKPVMEKVVRLVAADGGKDVFTPQKRLDTNEASQGVKYEKTGKGDIVRIDRYGNVTPVYQTDEFAANTETGGVFSKRTGLPAAGGIRQPGAGSGKATARLDTRVKMAIDKVILPKYGGRFEGGMFFPDEKNKDVAVRAIQIAGELTRGGMDPEAAGAKAIAQAEREKAIAETGGGTPNYSGPTPWKR
jgi:hypothetical protein